MSEHRTKPCPKCNGTAVSKPLMSGAHNGHMLQHCLHMSNPIAIGFGVLTTLVNGVKSHRFTCQDCGHSFFGR